VLVEYIVSIDVPCDSDFRDQWDAYDLVAQDGTKIEVKSASYLQSWKQEKPSAISFGIQPTFGWGAKTNTQSKKLKRQADVYVFCVLSHQDKSSVDPINLSQWDFYVLATQILDQEIPDQKTITLPSLLTLNPTECQFGEIWDAIKSVRQ
jgi:hypothetical protein